MAWYLIKHREKFTSILSNLLGIYLRNICTNMTAIRLGVRFEKWESWRRNGTGHFNEISMTVQSL